ncbi:hypothetical protein BH18ACI3_BH18ACI3_08640 [soil metagenome]
MIRVSFTFALVLTFSISLIFAQSHSNSSVDDKLIYDATTRPWAGTNYPELPKLPAHIRSKIYRELKKSQIREAYIKLDAKRRNVEWFDAIVTLEKKKAVWALLSCLVHPNEDVQSYAIRSLERVNNKKAVPFLLEYATSMAVLELGSENATIHGGIQESVARTLSKLTRIEIRIKGQDPEKLKTGLILWRKWCSENCD